MKVFLDMDGVLCDFNLAALAAHGIPYEIWLEWDHHFKWFKDKEKEFWAPMGEKFWEEIPWTTEGKEIFEAVEAIAGIDNIGILTTPCDTPGSMEGKKNWVRRELPQLVKRFWPGSTKEFMASPNHVLIDDSDGNVEKFAKAGGKAILVPRMWNKNSELVGENDLTPVNYIVEQLKIHMGQV